MFLLLMLYCSSAALAALLPTAYKCQQGQEAGRKQIVQASPCEGGRCELEAGGGSSSVWVKAVYSFGLTDRSQLPRTR